MSLRKLVTGSTGGRSGGCRDPRLESLRDDGRFMAALERARTNVKRMRAAVEAREATQATAAR